MNLLKKKGKSTIAFLGDSITADNRFNYTSMLINMLSEKMAIENIDIINSGVDSSSIFDALDRIPELFCENDKIDIIFVFIGVNDSKIFYGVDKPLVPINIYKEKYIDLLSLIKLKSTETQIVLINLPYLDFDKINNSDLLSDYWYWNIEEYCLYNNSIFELTREFNIGFVDIYNSFLMKANELSSYFTFDGVHPNAKGHQLIAQKILDLLQEKYV